MRDIFSHSNSDRLIHHDATDVIIKCGSMEEEHLHSFLLKRKSEYFTRALQSYWKVGQINDLSLDSHSLTVIQEARNGIVEIDVAYEGRALTWFFDAMYVSLDENNIKVAHAMTDLVKVYEYGDYFGSLDVKQIALKMLKPLVQNGISKQFLEALPYVWSSTPDSDLSLRELFAAEIKDKMTLGPSSTNNKLLAAFDKCHGLPIELADHLLRAMKRELAQKKNTIKSLEANFESYKAHNEAEIEAYQACIEELEAEADQDRYFCFTCSEASTQERLESGMCPCGFTVYLIKGWND